MGVMGGMGGAGGLDGAGGYGGGMGGARGHARGRDSVTHGVRNGQVAGTATDAYGDAVRFETSSQGGGVVGGSLSSRLPVVVDVERQAPVTQSGPAPALRPASPSSGPSDKFDVALRVEGAAPQIVVADGENIERFDRSRGRMTRASEGETLEKFDQDLDPEDSELGRKSGERSPPAASAIVDHGWRGSVSKDGKAALADNGVTTYGENLAERGAGVPLLPREPALEEAEGAGVELPALAVRSEATGSERYKRTPVWEDKPIVGGPFGREGQQHSLPAGEPGQAGRLLQEVKQSLKEESARSELAIPRSERPDPNRTSALAEGEGELPPASRFKLVPVNPWVMAERDRLSTFALDVDTASYTLCRRYILGGFLPPVGAVRMEEFINYFNYHYPQRSNPTFAIHAEAAPSPFTREDQDLTLLKIGVKARTIGRDQRKAAHLILVVDTSASMGQADRLPLVREALRSLVDTLSPADRVSLITCADEARLHLEATSARERDTIGQTIGAIQPAGATNLLAGLKLGYAVARRSFAPKQINQVVLCSDGVANVGQTEAESVLREVAADRRQGVTITCVGVGYGSYNDAFLEALANRGDGRYMFLDSVQAQQVFVEQFAATLQTVARDARIQVEFNPHRVRRYRLIGYENRDIEDQRFRDDTIDAGEVGSGQCSTALYELELIGRPSADRRADLGTVFVRYRDVDTGRIEEVSSRLSSPIAQRRTIKSDPRFFLAAGAARFAEWLRQSEHAQDGSLVDVVRVVEQVGLALPLDRDVREFAELVRKAEHLPRAP
jgi:Ca-activated chloride channel family protein